MMKGHSKVKRIIKELAREKFRGKRQLPEGKKESIQSIRTADDLNKLLSEINIPEQDIDEMLEEIWKEDIQDIEDDVPGEDPKDNELMEDYEDEEDDYVDYDEIGPHDPFDIEDIEVTKRALYVVEVLINNTPEIRFLQLPKFRTDDILINNALFNRYKLFFEMASFLAEKQFEYFLTGDNKKLNRLNQQDLVKYMNDKYKLSKEHISRMLDVLFFRIRGRGDIPSKYLFKRYGHRTMLSREEKLNLAIEFLNNCDRSLTQIDKAKKFRVFIKNKTGVEIPLSEKSKDEHDKYRNLKNIIKKAENMLKDEH